MRGETWRAGCPVPLGDLALRYAMSNSLGFGGHHSSLIFKRHED